MLVTWPSSSKHPIETPTPDILAMELCLTGASQTLALGAGHAYIAHRHQADLPIRMRKKVQHTGEKKQLIIGGVGLRKMNASSADANEKLRLATPARTSRITLGASSEKQSRSRNMTSTATKPNDSDSASVGF